MKSFFLEQNIFRNKIFHERKRSERSQSKFLAVFIDVTQYSIYKNPHKTHIFTDEILESIRITDVCGWYTHDTVIGILFLDIKTENQDILLKKISDILQNKALKKLTKNNHINYYLFPKNTDNICYTKYLYPDQNDTENRNKIYIKRLIDIIGSIFGMIIFSPFFILIPILIKISSKGPVFFKQKRSGYLGTEFTILKFRSMCSHGNDNIHKEYVEKYIKNKIIHPNNHKTKTYKIIHDPRVTFIGKIIRKTSLDEIPQFINVFLGDMSLVGPRPAIPYEVKHYEIWQKQRIIACKPGITGLWQVGKRSQSNFKDMVRLDIRYANYWSIWMDLKIIFKTPLALLSCKGAY